MDEKIKTWPLRFPAKENPNMEKALFDWPIVLQYDVKAKYRLISRKFSSTTFFQLSVRLTNQKLRAFVSVRKTNQIAPFPFVFILRSYENRSIKTKFVLGIFDSLKEDSTCIDRAVRQALLLAPCFSVVFLSARSLVLLVNCVNGHLYKRGTSVKRTPTVCPCLS